MFILFYFVTYLKNKSYDINILMHNIQWVIFIYTLYLLLSKLSITI